QEADREDRHGAEKGRDRVALLEELDREDRGQAAEDVEIVPLDDVADGCGNDDAAKFFARNISCCHKFPSLFGGFASVSRGPNRYPPVSGLRPAKLRQRRRQLHAFPLTW